MRCQPENSRFMVFWFSVFDAYNLSAVYTQLYVGFRKCDRFFLLNCGTSYIDILPSDQSLWGVFPRKGFSHVYPGQKNRCWCLSRQKYCSNVLDHFREGKVSGRKEKLLRKFCIRKSVHSVEKNTLLQRKYKKFVTRKEENNSCRRKNIPRERS